MAVPVPVEIVQGASVQKAGVGTTAQEVLTVSLMDVVMAVHVPVEIVQGASVQKAGVGTIAEEVSCTSPIASTVEHDDIPLQLCQAVR